MANYRLRNKIGAGWIISGHLLRDGTVQTVSTGFARDKAEVYAVMVQMAEHVSESRPKQLKLRVAQVNSGGQK